MTVCNQGKARAKSEDQLIAEFQEKLTTTEKVLVGSGDDCAVLFHPDQRSVVSTDLLVEGRHFSLEWSTPWEVGARAAQQNLADVAAMGAVAHSAVVGITRPSYLSDQDLVQLADGFTQTAQTHGCSLVGGDLTAGNQLVVAVTILGDLQGKEPLLRSGARPGDRVIFAGQTGWSALGLELLKRGYAAADGAVSSEMRMPQAQPSGVQSQVTPSHCALSKPLPSKVVPAQLQSQAKRAIQSFLVPNPPLVAAPRAAGHASAMMDVSDGLCQDLRKLAVASKVQINLDSSALEALQDFRELAEFLSLDPLTVTLTGGEDHGLVGTCPPAQLPTVLAVGFIEIGQVTQVINESGQLLLDGHPCELRGWDHFQSP